MKDIEDSKTSDSKTTLNFSKPSNNILQSNLTYSNPDMTSKQDSPVDLLSPKSNKSVLKLSSGPSTNTIKKKVLFHLEQEDNEREVTKEHSNELSVEDYEVEDSKYDFLKLEYNL